MEAIVLAGGLGTRLRRMVPELPKPMAPVGGRPFLEHQLQYWAGQGVQRFILSLGYRHESITRHFGATFGGAQIEHVVEPSPLGTGGGMLLAAEQLHGNEPFLVLNGDTFFEVPLAILQEHHRRRRAEVTICLFRSPQEGRYLGVEIDAAGQVLSLRSARAGRMANGGVYLVNPRAFAALGWAPGMSASLEEDLLPAALRERRRMSGFACAGRFIDIGVPSDYMRAEEVLACQ